MTLSEKLDLVDLRFTRTFENSTTPVPSLCIPALTLQDGPNGLGAGDAGVTQLPDSLGLGATFDPSLARAYGEVIGNEARRQGIDAAQGPNLNLVRVPEWGRAYETYGEDPFLSAILGVADAEGIQSQGVMSVAKHFTAYTQETGRVHIDQQVSRRALEEVYLAPFEAVVRKAGVAAIMCAYGAIDGVNACSDSSAFRILRSWGFEGFIRSDLGAVPDPVSAFRAGLDAIKPGPSAMLAAAVESGRLPMSDLDNAVTRVLREMFAYNLISRPRPPAYGSRVTTPAHARVALDVAEASAVLLKDANAVLPIVPGRLRPVEVHRTRAPRHSAGRAGPRPTSSRLTSTHPSRSRPPARPSRSRKRAHRVVAVIGVDAGNGAMTAGHGGARVKAPFVVTPVAALRRWLRRFDVTVTYTPGVPGDPPLASIPSRDLGGVSLPGPGVLAAIERRAAAHDYGVSHPPNVTPAVLTADSPGPDGHDGWTSWSATLSPPASGLYDISLTSIGDTWVYLGKKTLFAEHGIGIHSTWAVTVPLVRHAHYRLVMRWYSIPSGPAPHLGWADVSPAIASAARAARAASIAVVFVSDFTSEGVDRPNLDLPGAANAMISAVASANRRTVVVLNTAGAVVMPWLGQVAGVVEDWYPGEEDGNAITAVLSGAVDPSGHLPVTFPASNSQPFEGSVASWPGVDGKVNFSQGSGVGLDIGYTYYQVHHLRPLFAFGFGLSYTSFALSNLSVASQSGGEQAQVSVANTGKRSGCALVQGYLAYPRSAGEPPLELRAFTRTCLAPGTSSVATLHLPSSAFLAYLGGHWTTPRGTFQLFVGQSSADLPLDASFPAP